MNPLIDWEKGTLEWKKWKNSTLKKLDRSIIKHYTLYQRTINDRKKEKPTFEKKQLETPNRTPVTG
jgi:hypothetical protein